MGGAVAHVLKRVLMRYNLQHSCGTVQATFAKFPLRGLKTALAEMGMSAEVCAMQIKEEGFVLYA